MMLRKTIEQTVLEVLAEKGIERSSIDDQQRLVGPGGLDSLDLAVVVVRLERQLGCDPFRHGASLSTFGQLVAAYQSHLAGEGTACEIEGNDEPC